MDEDIKRSVDTNSAKAGNELGTELKEELAAEMQLEKKLFRDPSIPVFMRDSREGKKGNAQDEKDETEE